MRDAGEDDCGIEMESPEAGRPYWRRWPLAAPAGALAVLLAFALHAEVRYRRRVAAIRALRKLGHVEMCGEKPSAAWPWKLFGGPAASEPSVDYVSFNEPISDAEIEHVAQIEGLQHLRILHGKDVTDAGVARIAGLSGLTHLRLTDTRVTDAGLAHLRGLSRLKFIDLFGTRVTKEGVAELKKHLPNARIMRIM